MRSFTIFLLLLGLLILCAVAVIFAPFIGLGTQSEFILYRIIGMNRTEAVSYPLGLSFLLVVYALLSIGVDTTKKGCGPIIVLRSAWIDVLNVVQNFIRKSETENFIERRTVAALIVGFAAIFAIFLRTSLDDFQHYDQHWNQLNVDYDIDWGTPVFSLGGDVLHHFGIQAPLNTQLLPLQGLATWAFPVEYRMIAAIALFFLGAGGLFWLFGSALGLRTVPRVVFAGLTALLITIPKGLDRLIWIIPPNFFTRQYVFAMWWLEAPILLFATVLLFFWLGQRRSLKGNLAAAIAFAVMSISAVLSYPLGALYFVPMIIAYCLALLLTSTDRHEFAWKIGTGLLLGAAMIVASVPQFFTNLYGYTIGTYFFDSIRMSTVDLFRDSFLVIARNIDFRAIVISFLTFAVSIVMAIKFSGAMRRFAVAVLFCEAAIVVIGTLNALFWRAPLMLSYAENASSPFWAANFVLFFMALVVVVDRRLAIPPRSANGSCLAAIAWAHGKRRTIYLASLLAAIAVIALEPRRSDIQPFPPKRTESIRALEAEIGLVPGAIFKGRALLLVATRVDGSGYDEFLNITANKYGRLLGNDHYIDLMHFNIPMVNEYAHWTSPIGFAFLRSFFGSESDTFTKALFPLRTFNLTIAKMMGIRMVITDAEAIPGGTKIFETVAGETDLRIFRIDNTNVGNYSPTQSVNLTTAAEMIAAMRSAAFDPTQDVIVESALPDSLTPATSANVHVALGPTLVVSALSPGKSLLVLPFEYSHCLRLQTTNMQARLIPVNLQQTGLLFSGNIRARITYRFGLFSDSACRGEDVSRANSLRLISYLTSERPDASSIATSQNDGL